MKIQNLSHFAAAFAPLLAMAIPLHAAPLLNFTVVDLGAGTVGAALNDSGTVVGQLNIGNSSYPFSWSNGVLTKIAVPGIQGYSGATGINNQGTIVGVGFVNPNTYSQPFVAFEDQNGVMQIISNPGGTTAASGINNSGVVAGGYALNYSNFFYDPFTYSNGTFDSLGAFGPAWVNYGTAINDQDTVVGYYSNPNTNQGENAFSYSNGVYTALGTLPGGYSSTANAINDLGVIAGFSTIAGGFDHAYSYSNGVMTDLGTLAGYTYSYANGIDNAGEIVGYGANSNAPPSDANNHAFVYVDGTMSDLNSDLAQPLTTSLIDAVAVNNEGQIVALGANGDTYLLTPTPEPSPAVYVLTGAGLMLLGWRRRIYR